MRNLDFRPLAVLVLGLALWGSGAKEVVAQPDTLSPPLLAPAPSAELSMTPEQARQSVQWLADLLMLYVPRTIEGDDDWGETKRVWAGVKVHREKLELKTNRRWRDLRHGRWVRYEITLPEPALPPNASEPLWGERDNQQQSERGANPVEIRSVVPVVSPTGDRRWKIDASAATPASFVIRVQRWNLGTKWYSVEITGNMKLHLQTTLTMALRPDFSEVPPAIELDVDIEDASLSVTEFEVRRVSKLGRDIAEEIGNLTEKTIMKTWLRKENERLTGRLNKAIEKKRSSLRWSMADWLAQLAQ